MLIADIFPGNTGEEKEAEKRCGAENETVVSVLSSIVK